MSKRLLTQAMDLIILPGARLETNSIALYLDWARLNGVVQGPTPAWLAMKSVPCTQTAESLLASSIVRAIAECCFETLLLKPANRRTHFSKGIV
jgi:hypothetical protein